MNRVDALFARLRSEGRTALMPFVTGGDPDADTSLRILLALAEGGADLLEIGLPFSDPLADGPTLQASAGRALAAGFRVDTLWDLLRQVRSRFPELPLVVLTYMNPVLHRGVERFLTEAREAGVDGLVIPDLALEEGEHLRRQAEAAGIRLVAFLAPTSDDSRLQRVAEAPNKGFVYCVALTGVTGAREGAPNRAVELVERARAVVPDPLVVGFGIGSPEAAAALRGRADGVIVGSALVDRISPLLPAEKPAAAAAFLRPFRDALAR